VLDHGSWNLLTAGVRAGSVQHAIHDIVSFHPSLNLIRFDVLASHTEVKIVLVCLDEVSVLAVSDNGLHLIRFDVLVELPLGQARPVLAYSENAVSLDTME